MPYDISAIVKIPYPEGVINERAISGQNKKNVTVYLATRDKREDALTTRDKMVEELESKGVIVRDTRIFHRSRERA